MRIQIQETEFNIAGQKMADYVLSFAEYTLKIAKHLSKGNNIETHKDKLVIVRTPLTTYVYSLVVVA